VQRQRTNSGLFSWHPSTPKRAFTDARQGQVGSGIWADEAAFCDARIELAAATTAVGASGLGAVMQSDVAVVEGIPPNGRQI